MQAVLRRRATAPWPGGARRWLFGSWARGDWRQRSDIDMPIEPLEPVPERLFPDIRAAIENSEIPFIFDVLDFRRLDPEFRAEIERAGN